MLVRSSQSAIRDVAARSLSATSAPLASGVAWSVLGIGAENWNFPGSSISSVVASLLKLCLPLSGVSGRSQTQTKPRDSTHASTRASQLIGTRHSVRTWQIGNAESHGRGANRKAANQVVSARSVVGPVAVTARVRGMQMQEVPEVLGWVCQYLNVDDV